MDLEGTYAIDQKFSFATFTRPKCIAVDMAKMAFLASTELREVLTVTSVARKLMAFFAEHMQVNNARTTERLKAP